MRFISRTLRRYHRDNLTIIACDLHFGFHKQKSASRAEKWIKKLVTSKTCLKELCLSILPAIASYTLPDELFSSEKLDKLSLKLMMSPRPILFTLVAILGTVTWGVGLRGKEGFWYGEGVREGMWGRKGNSEKGREKELEMWFVEEIDDTSEATNQVIAPEQFELHMIRVDAIIDIFFLKMRAALNLSNKFKIELECYGFMVPFDIDDVRRRITFPATNVEKLLLVSDSPENSLDKSLLIDVLFSICRPNQEEFQLPGLSPRFSMCKITLTFDNSCKWITKLS
nr:hypothetical protein [Tanacetum cinerariifolium]